MAKTSETYFEQMQAGRVLTGADIRKLFLPHLYANEVDLIIDVFEAEGLNVVKR